MFTKHSCKFDSVDLLNNLFIQIDRHDDELQYYLIFIIISKIIFVRFVNMILMVDHHVAVEFWHPNE